MSRICILEMSGDWWLWESQRYGRDGRCLGKRHSLLRPEGMSEIMIFECFVQDSNTACQETDSSLSGV